MQISKSKSSAVENEAFPLAVVSVERHEFDLVDTQTPLHALLEAEDNESLSIGSKEEASIQIEAVSGLLSFLFRLTSNGKMPSPIEVLERLYLLVYTIRPALIHAWSLDRIAACFESSRQCFSKKLLKQNELMGGVKSRNQKSSLAVSRYRENTREWHAERKRQRTAEQRKEYLRRWRVANAAEVRAYQASYRAKYRERLNAAKRKARLK